MNLIQQKSGCVKVQIDQNVGEGTPCKALITGQSANQQYAIQLMQEIMQHGAQRIHAMPGLNDSQQQGHGMMGGGVYGPGGGMGGGMYGGAAMGGGMYGAQGMGGMYGAQGMYGANPMMQQQAQGMYGMYGAAMGGGNPYGATPAANPYGNANPYAANNPAAATAAPVAQAKPAQASPWSEHKTDEGHLYWYNATTGVSQVKASKIVFIFIILIII